MLDPCQSTRGRLVTLDLGLVSGVPILEAPPSLFWDILNHSMKDYIDPSWLRSCGGLGWCCASCLHSSGFICINLHLSALVCTYRQLVCTDRQIVCTDRQLVCTYRHYCGMFGGMLDPCQSTKGRLVTLDLGLVSGVPILEAPPSLFWDILNHSMKDYIDPSWLRSCGGLGWCCASCLHSSGFICINLHLSATSLHLSALVCTYRH